MLLALGIILVVLMVVVGGDRGVGSVLALVANMVIMFFAIKLISMGVNPYVIVLLASLLFLSVTLIYQNGTNMKSLAAVIAVIIVMVILTCFIAVVVNKTRIAGYSEVDRYEEITMYVSTNISVKMDQVMVCVVLLGLLGAIMDTSIAITTAVYEIHRNNPHFGSKQLLRSGRNVGKDIMGTTVNTLLLATVGETIMLNVLYLKFHYTFAKLLNSKSFFQEFCLIIFSNIGCLLIIPISNRVISYLLVSDLKVAVWLRHYLAKKEEEEG